MFVGAEVIIGDKYAKDCSYEEAVGEKATVLQVYERDNPYLLQGKHTICYTKVNTNREWDETWEVHIDDCHPVSNRDAKHVLERYDT